MAPTGRSDGDSHLRPEAYQGSANVVLYAMFDFAQMTDRAVILEDGEPFAIADGRMREIATP